jgi:hypothetical protein
VTAGALAAGLAWHARGRLPGRAGLGIALLALLLPAGAGGDPKAVPRPAFMARKPFLPDLLIDDKPEGRFFTAVPAVGVDPDDGLQFGGFGEFYDNGSRSDPFFASSPYRRLLFAGAVFGSEEFFRGGATLDLPYFRESAWRVRGSAEVEHRGFENYFGLGSASLSRLRNPITGETFDDLEDYREDIRTISPEGTTLAAFNQYENTRAALRATLERDMLGGLLRPMAGLQISWVDVDTLDGERVDAAGGSARQGPTLLGLDCAAGRVLGCDGGFDNLVRLGVTWDTRDFEPDPRSGILAQLTGELSSQVLGSEFDYRRLTLHASGYWSPLPERADLVVAARGYANWQSGDVPFYSQPFLAITTDPSGLTGLGGFDTLRGFTRNRFVGKVATGASAELRFTFGEGRVFGQHLMFKIVPFVDAGRVFDTVSEVTLDDWEFGYGVGFRLAWQISTVVSFDWGRSREGDAFYMELGHAF